MSDLERMDAPFVLATGGTPAYRAAEETHRAHPEGSEAP